LHHTTRSPLVIFSAPATTIADRPSPLDPSATGQDNADTATISVP
jgi:hypothetical protein